MAARSGSYLLVTSILTAVYLGGLYFTMNAANRGPFVKVLKWVLIGLVTPVLVIGVPTYIAKKVLESRRQAQAAQSALPDGKKDGKPGSAQ